MRHRPKESEQKIAARQRHGLWAARLLKLLGLTLRFSVQDKAGVLASVPPPHIYVLWHNRLASAAFWYRRVVQPPRQIAALISASGDGDLLAAAMKQFDYQPVRGSRSRGGMEATRQLLKCLEAGMDVGITPDGPRGPRYSLQPGALAIARLSGKPLVPLRFHLSQKIELGTWDRFQIPLPFSSCRLEIQEPMFIVSEEDEMRGTTLLLERLACR